ncbi:type II toxin-antitoxin system RelE/ParE family toxin [Mobiluncus mulieris]|uniref:type II toxin-antitoxin system RelE/ParE family toxin n=1 Tax=Mobiluncus mulieris TaxID=2052 RepID=UPI00325AC33A
MYSYIAVELLAPDTAAELFERLISAISSLSQMPYRFRLWEDEPWQSLGLRLLVVGNYVVLYLPDEPSKTVNIVRIMYRGRDIAVQLAETFPDDEDA